MSLTPACPREGDPVSKQKKRMEEGREKGGREGEGRAGRKAGSPQRFLRHSQGHRYLWQPTEEGRLESFCGKGLSLACRSLACRSQQLPEQ